MKVLIACEQSQTIANAYRARKIEAYSCDILPCYGGHPEYHIIADARHVIKGHGTWSTETGAEVKTTGAWDIIIAHPPCTMLTHVSAVALAQGKHTIQDVEEAAKFFLEMLNAPCDRVAVENPAPMKIAKLPPYNQIIQPWQFGEQYSKRVCLWLRGLPPLLPTCYVPIHRQWHKHCSSTSKRRSKTFQGIADAIAQQWV